MIGRGGFEEFLVHVAPVAEVGTFPPQRAHLLVGHGTQGSLVCHFLHIYLVKTLRAGLIVEHFQALFPQFILVFDGHLRLLRTHLRQFVEPSY